MQKIKESITEKWKAHVENPKIKCRKMKSNYTNSEKINNTWVGRRTNSSQGALVCPEAQPWNLRPFHHQSARQYSAGYALVIECPLLVHLQPLHHPLHSVVCAMALPNSIPQRHWKRIRERLEHIVGMTFKKFCRDQRGRFWPNENLTTTT